jgi:hypothetical protein
MIGEEHGLMIDSLHRVMIGEEHRVMIASLHRAMIGRPRGVMSWPRLQRRGGMRSLLSRGCRANYRQL